MGKRHWIGRQQTRVPVGCRNVTTTAASAVDTPRLGTAISGAVAVDVASRPSAHVDVTDRAAARGFESPYTRSDRFSAAGPVGNRLRRVRHAAAQLGVR